MAWECREGCYPVLGAVNQGRLPQTGSTPVVVPVPEMDPVGRGSGLRRNVGGRAGNDELVLDMCLRAGGHTGRGVGGRQILGLEFGTDTG